MPRPATAHLPLLSRRARNRALLARQLLLERSRTHGAAAALEQLVGLQAQAPQPPYYALWSRLADFDPHGLGRMLSERRVVRMTLMRNTVHLVTARDALWLRPLLQSVIGRSVAGSLGRRLAGVDPAALGDAASEVLAAAGEPLSGREIAARVLQRGLGEDAEAVRYAVAARLALVQVPPRGVWGRSGQAKYVTLEAWTQAQQQRDPSLEDAVIRYLRAFGPATVMDMQKWSGLTRCRSAFERLRPGLISFRDEDGQELFDLPDAPRPDPETPAPVRLLGEFDNLLLSHADRRHIIPNGATPWMDPAAAGRHVNTAIIDGMLRAIWWIEREPARRATLVLRPLERLATTERAALRAEAERMVAFAAGDAAVTSVRFD